MSAFCITPAHPPLMIRRILRYARTLRARGRKSRPPITDIATVHYAPALSQQETTSDGADTQTGDSAGQCGLPAPQIFSIPQNTELEDGNDDDQPVIHGDLAILEATEDSPEHDKVERCSTVSPNSEMKVDEPLLERGLSPHLDNIDIFDAPYLDESGKDIGEGLLPLNGDEDDLTGYLYRIISNKSIPLLMLGEGSKLSMTIAVAFMRGSFSNIHSSTFQLQKRPQAIEQIQILIEHQRQDVRGSYTRDASATPVTPDDMANVTLNVDATNLKAALKEYPQTPTSLIWFPFPCKVGKTAHGLLRGIVESAASVQQNNATGGVLLISVSRNPLYTSRYGDLSDIICYTKELGYEHRVEAYFINTICCEFGYRHRWEGQDRGGRSIHDKVINPSSTHIFIMRSTLALH